jgi:hypothetical protein
MLNDQTLVEAFVRTDPWLMRLLILIACLVVLNIAIALLDLYVDLKHARPVRRRAAVSAAAERGAAYAEQLGRSRKLERYEKFQHALHAARDELKALGVRFTEAELGRAIEVAVSQLSKA